MFREICQECLEPISTVATLTSALCRSCFCAGHTALNGAYDVVTAALRPGSVRTYTRALRHLPYDGFASPQEVLAYLMANRVTTRSAAGVALSAARRTLTANQYPTTHLDSHIVTDFQKGLDALGRIPSSALLYGQLPRPHTKKRLISETDAGRIIQKLWDSPRLVDKRDAAIATTLAFTGRRFDTVIKLCSHDFTSTPPFLRVQESTPSKVVSGKAAEDLSTPAAFIPCYTVKHFDLNPGNLLLTFLRDFAGPHHTTRLFAKYDAATRNFSSDALALSTWSTSTKRAALSLGLSPHGIGGSFGRVLEASKACTTNAGVLSRQLNVSPQVLFKYYTRANGPQITDLLHLFPPAVSGEEGETHKSLG